MDFATYQNLIEQNKHRTDDGVLARFYDRVVKTGAFTEKGLPVFKTVCYCEVRIKDNTTEVFDQPADAEKIARFPVEYARYQLSKKQASDGTPLEQFAFLDIAEIEACKYRGIFTVEALADLSLERARDLGLINECRLAREFITNGKEFKRAIDVQERIKAYESKISTLEAELANLKKIKPRRKGK